jgi:peptidoglycan/xylan/chitin deacetylase (PgdA/CDA1 family)
MSTIHEAGNYATIRNWMRKPAARTRATFLAVLGAVCAASPAWWADAARAPASQASTPAVSLTFSRSRASTFTAALPILRARGLRGVAYCSSGYVGKPGFLTWTQVRELQDRHGWEIGGETVNHGLATEWSDGELRYELEQDRDELAAHGIRGLAFASPFGDYNNRVLAAIARAFQSHRALGQAVKAVSTRRQDRDPKGLAQRPAPGPERNRLPYNRYLVRAEKVEAQIPVARVIEWIDQARQSGDWLVLAFAEIVAGTPAEATAYSAGALEQIAEYVKRSGLRAVTVREMFEPRGANLLPNGTFDDDLGSGWTTDDPGTTAIDGGNRGCWPSPRKSLELTGGARGVRVTSPAVPIRTGVVYEIRSFMNTVGLESGEAGYALHEYDSSDKLLRDTPLAAYGRETDDVFEAAFRYVPSDTRAASCRISVHLGAGARGKLYVDGFEWHAASGEPPAR